MARQLSSNWELLSSELGGAQSAPKKQVHKKKKEVKRMPRKETKIMTMVYNMNKVIAKRELDKKEGKEFQFKSSVCLDAETNKKLDDIIEQDLNGKEHAKKTSDIGKYVAIDCEFVGVGLDGKDHALARISMTNYFGHVVLDKFVRPREKVTDWRTEISGITPSSLKEAITFKEAQKMCADLLKGRILVGHAVKHDLDALLLSHPKSMIRDTSRHLPFRHKYAGGKSPSLRKLTKEVLGTDIQGGEHSSVEDARATMLLYKSEKREFEKLHKKTFGSESR
ncbi:putative 3'-5' exonuclease KNAG_0K00900 [Huiozyma naganishii CBS 8797]|uniref:RNA exonuclease 4 n=1 Tax=Huiozyma naganishii (strain ATCC MYA-139 / BCRC 22969 / CBS 8797 / KCTC 17520 / NBRC 10181 / NCYC 3082 / Yp74L-3) TaxID=1071383 RepID=J7RC37_HUIN7|nr:hypothetical protein KNAG_0K00900 [Kazachstania naganishii CBS 8797]CCK72455.1 hypothetical protein KNAG_0K00900 [Kazachstania naganishii CBS 8797]